MQGPHILLGGQRADEEMRAGGCFEPGPSAQSICA